MQLSEAAMSAARHPQDPDPIPSTKASAALMLSLVALLTSPLIGGVVPAAMALRLCRQADEDITRSEGFLLGAKRNGRARLLAKIALCVTGFVVLLAVLWWLYALYAAGPQVHDVDPNVN